MDEARVIPLHGDGADRAARPRAASARHPSQSGAATAAIYSFGEAAVEPAAAATPASWEQKLAGGLAFLRRRLSGDYEVDEYGFDRDLYEHILLQLLSPLYDSWFRVEVNGIDNVPHDGGALLVANHAGGLWALDAAMTAFAVRREHPAQRPLRMLSADLVFQTPGFGAVARKAGATLACNADAERLLASGELVGVWPEGFKGIGKSYSQRYKLQRFGRGGFVHAALATGVPIIPVSIVGSEEAHPVLADAKLVARLLNLPYFPLTPTFPWLGPLGLVPLPSKWYIEFGTPVQTAHYGAQAAEDPALLFELTDRVRETIQSTLYRLLVQRRSVWR